jgi:hypothetical protein
MPKVLCTLPNASDLISGVKFVTHAAGMLSEEISDEVADGFIAVPGYELVGEKKPSAEEADAAAAAKEAAKAALLARAEAVELKVKANWSLERLTAEVESAEEKAAAAKAEADKKSEGEAA